MITDEQMNLLVSLKVAYVIIDAVREMGITTFEALDMFYDSTTYELLSDKKTYYWGESQQYVAESFNRECNGLPIEEL